MRLEELREMVNALVKGDTESASAHFKTAASMTIRSILEKDKDHDDDKEKPDYVDLDKDGDEKESMKKAAKDKKKKDKDHDDDDDDKDDDDVKESLAHKGGPVDDKEKEYGTYRHNHDGEVYHKVPHKDDSEGYGHEKSKAASRNLEAKSDSGAKEKKKDAYKDTVHKDDSEGYGHEKSKKHARSGLKKVEKSTTSPDSDGKKENRRTDKTAKYHGTDRGGKDVSSK